MARVRHYRTTTTYRGNGVTHRTVESKLLGGGGYRSPQQNKDALIAIGALVGIGLAIAWPFAITAIPLWARWLIAAPWYLLLIVFCLWVRRNGRRAKQTATSPKTQAPPTPANQPAPPASRNALPGRQHETAFDRIQAAPSKPSPQVTPTVAPITSPPPGPTASAPARPAARNAAPTQTTVELTTAEKKDLEDRYDEIRARMEAMRQHLNEYQRRQGDKSG